MAKRHCKAVTFFKTNYPDEINCFGIGPREGDLDYRGLDSTNNKIIT